MYAYKYCVCVYIYIYIYIYINGGVSYAMLSEVDSVSQLQILDETTFHIMLISLGKL